jgi:hypothetical protein
MRRCYCPYFLSLGANGHPPGAYNAGPVRAQVILDGRRFDRAASYTEGGEGRKATRTLLGGAALGASVGGVANGGSGAAIGASAGGSALSAAGHSHLKPPAQTRLQFPLPAAVTIP